jgi:hypothetical protein
MIGVHLVQFGAAPGDTVVNQSGSATIKGDRE